MRVTKLALLLLVAFLGALGEPAAAARPTSEPYKGDLSIFEDASRAQKLQVERVMDLLGIKRGTQVADIGAGSGWFTVRSARRVGHDGLVYAVEINPEFVRHIERRAKREKLENIRTILGKPDDPMLPRASIDATLLLKTYHEIAQPIAFLRRLRAALRPGARIGIIDRRGKGDDHGVNADVVIKEAAQAGFKLVAQHDFVKGDSVDYFLIFQARGAE
jgi:predicted methyltransferase